MITTAIEVDITPRFLSKPLKSIIGNYTAGKLIFLPTITDGVGKPTTSSGVMEDDNTRSSKKGVKAKEVLSYLRSLDD